MFTVPNKSQPQQAQATQFPKSFSNPARLPVPQSSSPISSLTASSPPSSTQPQQRHSSAQLPTIPPAKSVTPPPSGHLSSLVSNKPGSPKLDSSRPLSPKSGPRNPQSPQAIHRSMSPSSPQRAADVYSRPIKMTTGAASPQSARAQSSKTSSQAKSSNPSVSVSAAIGKCLSQCSL